MGEAEKVERRCLAVWMRARFACEIFEMSDFSAKEKTGGYRE